jgi:predicted acylesterase/phospholipase RssA/CRP-like cAMP-binding protein
VLRSTGDALRQARAFAGVDEETLAVIGERLASRTIPGGQVLCEAGDDVRSLGIVVSGALEVLTSDADGRTGDASSNTVETVLRAPATFGEWSLLGGGVRSAGLRALGTTVIAELSVSDFDQLAQKHPAMRAVLFENVSRHMEEIEFDRAVVRAWGRSDPGALVALRDLATFRSYSPGDLVVREGAPARSALLVLTGGLRVITRRSGGFDGAPGVASPDDTDNTTTALAQAVLGPGQLVGERALLDDGVRNATLQAVRPSRIAEFDSAGFQQLCLDHPQVLLATTRSILRRHDTATRSGRPAPQRLAVVGDGIVDTADFVRRMAGLFPFPVKVLTADDAARAVGLTDDISDDAVSLNASRVAAWIDRHAQSTEWTLFAAEPSDRRWTQTALLHADQIVALASTHGSAPSRHPVWSSGPQTQPVAPMQPTTLVLVHPSTTRLPSETSRILRRLPAGGHLHLRENHPDDLARVTRTLAGVPVGLVLSGGGARGFAHLGAVKSMREIGIPCDVIGGTSIGAVMALYQGFDMTVEEQLRQTEIGFTGLFDYTLPVVSLLKGQRTSDRLQEFVGDHTIEDLWIPYFCVSTNLSSNDMKVHRTGALATAVRASLALPGIFPPVHDGEHFLIDGGVLNNFPLDVMRAVNPFGRVIAVDVAARVLLEALGNFGLQLSGWRAAASMIRKKPLAPSLASTLVRTSVIGSARERERYLRLKFADLHLELALEQCGLLDFDAVREVAAFGYAAAHPRLKAWWEQQKDRLVTTSAGASATTAATTSSHP